MGDFERDFAGRFEPVAGGYVLYPRRRSGGSFVSEEEYDRLRASYEHRHWALTRTLVPVYLILIPVLVTLSNAFGLPESVLLVATGAIAIVLLGLQYWLALEPARLVRGRETIAPPRSHAEAARIARDLTPWSTIFAVVAFSAAALWLGLVFRGDGLWSWGWRLVFAALLARHLWLGFRKLQDR